jgi:hypothetical protein
VAERENDLVILAGDWLRGHSQRALALQFGLSRRSIQKDLSLIRERWKQDMVNDYDSRVACELAKLAAVESEFWAAYESTTDLACLSGVLKCLERRAKLCGYDAPTKVAPTNPSGTESYQSTALSGVSNVDLAAILLAIPVGADEEDRSGQPITADIPDAPLGITASSDGIGEPLRLPTVPETGFTDENHLRGSFFKYVPRP